VWGCPNHGLRGAKRHLRVEQIQEKQRQFFERLAIDLPLDEVLVTLTEIVETQIGGGICSVLLLESDGKHLRHCAARSLPEAYTRAIDGEAIGPQAGSCGTAAFRGDQGYWSQIETYIQAHSEADFTHGICPDCVQRLYGDLYIG
jgi:hypothetical protein